MKRIKFLFAGLALVSGLAMSSCNKQNETTPVHNQKSTARGTDDIGAVHNKGMDYFLEHADFKVARKEVYPMTQEFCEKEGYDAETISKILDDALVKEVIACPDESALQTYFKKKEMKTESDFLASMVSAIEAASNSEEAAKSLALVAEKISESGDMADESKAALLHGISVGKSSADYWFAQADLGTESPWIIKYSDATSSELATTAKKIKWWKVIVKDLVGTVSGALAGNVPGAIAGAVGGSGDEVISQLDAPVKDAPIKK